MREHRPGREEYDLTSLACMHMRVSTHWIVLGVLTLGCVLGFAPDGRSVAPIPIPPLARTEEGAYQALNARTGERMWHVNWTVRQFGPDSNPVFDFSEKGSGHPDQFVPAAWTVDMRIALWGEHARISSKREALDAQGHTVEIEQRDFDYTAGKGVIETTAVNTGRRKTTSVPLTGDSIPAELLGAYLRLLPDTSAQQMRFDLTTREGYVIGMEARIVGRERVTVPAGTFDCYKIELDPTGLAGILARAFRLPKLFMWHSVAAPHFWVKYQGLEGGPGSPVIVRELVRFHAG